MLLAPTAFYQSHLAVLHQQLLDHTITKAFLTGNNIRLDGEKMMADDELSLPMGAMSMREFAHLFSVFDDSRVHGQAEKRPQFDEALMRHPPGCTSR